MKKLLCLILALAMTLALVACSSGTNTSDNSTAQNPDTNNTSDTNDTSDTPTDNDADKTDDTVPAGDPIEIKLVSTNPSSNPEIIEMVDHCKNIYERTNGMVDIQVYADGQMLVYNEGIDAVMNNSAVIYFTACNLFSDYVPELTSVYMPYLYSSIDVAEEFFQSEVWQQIADKADAAGLHIISNNIFTGYRHMFANKPVTSPDDFVGLTMRIPDSTLYIETFKALKTNYMPLAFSEVYSGLQTGMLDGVEGTAATISGYSLWETMDPCYYSLTKHVLDNGGYFVGYDFWMSIPEEYRTIIEEELYQAAADSNVTGQELEADFINQMIENGVEIVEIEDLTPFQEAVADLITSQPMGQEILDQISAIENK